MKNISFYSLSGLFHTLPFLVLLFLLADCGNKSEDPSPKPDSNQALINSVLGAYEVEGVYDRIVYEKSIVTISQSGTRLTISGTGFPAFQIKDLYVGYQNPKVPTEQTLFSERVEPHEGSVNFIFPGPEIVIIMDLKVDTSTKKLLTLSGKKL